MKDKMNKIPKLKFAHLPTKVEPLPRLSTHLGDVDIWIKRDDQTGLAFGGNKTRKLEYLVAEAQAHGARTLITTGAVQSNHCRQTAAIAAKAGLDCILVLTGDEPAQSSGNFYLDLLLGAETIFTSHSLRDQVLQSTFEKAWEDGKRPYLIPYGGSSPVGAAAYTFAMDELLEQASIGETPGGFPDWIVFPSSSGGTQAGLVTGAKVFDFSGKILGISVDQPASVLKELVANLANATADLLGEPANFQAEDIIVNDHYIGEGYGEFSEAERNAILLFARMESILLDPVYTSRAAAGMVDLIRRGFFTPGSRILFWHTGGTPALFSDRYQASISGSLKP